MKRQIHPTRIGLFVLAGLALLVGLVVLVSGGGLFSRTERAVARFDGSVYGLQLGAPVVFRGVRIGSVTGIGVSAAGTPGRFVIPVQMELERGRIGAAPGAAEPTLAELVRQGLTARLSTQSLLTGLLYVDLDLRPAASTAPKTTAAAAPDDAIEIPTAPTPLEALQQRLSKLDIDQLLADISGLAAGARQLVASPRWVEAATETAGAAAELKRLAARLEQQVAPISTALKSTLDQTQRTAADWGGETTQRANRALDQVTQAADRVSGTMGRFDGLAESAKPALQSVQRAADDLARTSSALRTLTAEDGVLLPQVERAAQDLARASRAVRDLADLLERQPEALLRGRSDSAAPRSTP